MGSRRQQSAPQAEPITIEQAWEQFLTDARDPQSRPPTLSKYELLRRRMEQFAGQSGLRFLREFDLAMCRTFPHLWPLQNLAALKTLERLRTFFRFAADAGWIAANPTVGLKNPKVTNSPTLPFNSAEMAEILGACDAYQHQHPKAGEANALRLRAFVLLLRYSGLRIRDAVTWSANASPTASSFSTRRRPEPPCTAHCRRLWSQVLEASTGKEVFLLDRPITTRRARLATGSALCADCSN